MVVAPNYFIIILSSLLLLIGIGACIYIDVPELRREPKPPLSETVLVIILSNLFLLGLSWGVGIPILNECPYSYTKITKTIQLSEQMPKNMNYISQKEASIPSKQFSYLNKKGEQKALDLNENSRIFWKKSKENKLVVTTKAHYSIFGKKIETEICKLTVYYTE